MSRKSKHRNALKPAPPKVPKHEVPAADAPSGITYRPPYGRDAVRPPHQETRPVPLVAAPPPPIPAADDWVFTGALPPGTVEEVLAARRRMLRLHQAMELDRIAPLPGGQPRTLPDDLTPGDAAHLLWVTRHMPDDRSEPFGEEVPLRRRYRLDFARFGGARPYLDVATYRRTESEYVRHKSRDVVDLVGSPPAGLPAEIWQGLQHIKDQSSPEECDRLSDLLLKEVWLVADVLPPDPPPRPPDWAAPAAGTYGPPTDGVLALGPSIGVAWPEDLAADTFWDTRAGQEELVRVATDPGLLLGWPGEPASWAPYHALVVLREVFADWAVPELLRILDIVRDEDWISDMLLARCLPTIGPATEPALWSVLRDDRRGQIMRGQAVLGLRNLARDYPECSDEIAQGLVDFLLETDPADLADPECWSVNSHVGLVLDEEPFADAEWLAARRAAAELLSPAPPAPPT